MALAPPAITCLLDTILNYYPIVSSPPRHRLPALPARPLSNHSAPFTPPTPPPLPLHCPKPLRTLDLAPLLAFDLPPSLAFNPQAQQLRYHPRSMTDLDGGPAVKRPSASPGRHHHGLSALSPLQTFSPLQPVAIPRREGSGRSRANSAAKEEKPSLSRSLSRRQSLYRNAEKWDAGEEYVDENMMNPGSLYSRLTLVKAPAEKEGIRA